MKSPTFTMRVFSVLRWSVALVLLLLLLFAAYVYLPVIQDPREHYLERKGVLDSVVFKRHWQDKLTQYDEVLLRSSSELEVELLVRQPLQQSRPLPVAILLGGIRTGHKACELMLEIRDVICASLSYPGYRAGRYDGAAFFYRIREVQQGIKDTPPAILLALEYLLRQSYTDAEQVELVGVSLGAFVVSVPAVLDQRISRVWVVQGAAEPINVIQHNLLRKINSDFLSTVCAHLIGYAIGSHHIDPVNWVGNISPREVIFINSEDDKAFPRASVDLLHMTAQQPKEIIWIKGTHVSQSRKDIIQKLTDIILNRIAENGLPSTPWSPQ